MAIRVDIEVFVSGKKVEHMAVGQKLAVASSLSTLTGNKKHNSIIAHIIHRIINHLS